MEPNYIISSIYIKAFSSYKMFYNTFKIWLSRWGNRIYHICDRKDQSSLRIHAFLKLLSEKNYLIIIIYYYLGTELRKFQVNFHIFTSHSTYSLALDLMMKFSWLSLKTTENSIYTTNYEFDKHYKNMTIQIIERNLPPKYEKFLIKILIFFISDQNLRCSCEPSIQRATSEVFGYID